jgi:hypothetical protein
MSLGKALHERAAMAGLELMEDNHWELARGGKEGEGEEEGVARESGTGRGRAAGGGAMGRACGLLLRACSLLCVKELDVRKERRRKERRK